MRIIKLARFKGFHTITSLTQNLSIIKKLCPRISQFITFKVATNPKKSKFSTLKFAHLPLLRNFTKVIHKAIH